MIPWGTLNRALYGTARWYAEVSARSLPALLPTGTTSTGDDILYVAWGRIGDAILGNAALDLLRRRTGRRIVVAGRAVTRPVVMPHADGFIPLPESGDAQAAAEFTAAAAGPWFAVVGDLHVFFGGTRLLGQYLASVPARHRLLYEGYAPRTVLARDGCLPAGIELVASLAKPAGDIGSRHVLFDAAHYLQAVLTRLGAQHTAVALDDLVPRLLLRANMPPRRPFIVCQPFSNLRKKDWPAARWRDLFAAFPSERFLLLGSSKDHDAAQTLRAPNVDTVCGTTELEAAFGLIAEARAFLGVDSGLAHAAAALCRPTVVVSHSANLGYFFPYPAALHFGHVSVVHDARYAACSGCLSVCTREPIWRTYRQGALCVRDLRPGLVHAALAQALARPDAAVTEIVAASTPAPA
jgi:hypothetical protein